MKLVLYSPAFLPQIGGLELNVAHLAAEIAAAGNDVVVITTTPGASSSGPGYRVVRNPSPLALVRWVRWADVFFQANVSLKGLWPLLLVRRPWVVSHHSWYCRSDGRVAWQDRLKRYLVRYASASIAVSQALARDVGRSLVIPNSYRDDLFRLMPEIRRTVELLFVGRLVSEKGVDVLLEALAILAGRGVRPRLTVVGEGPERQRLESQARELGLDGRVTFTGKRVDKELVRTMNEHRLLIVPSRYNEPFGIVALEGIACGCYVIGSRGGGLPEAIGECGTTFENGDATELASLLDHCLRHAAIDASARQRHLHGHAATTVVSQYLHVLDTVAARNARAVLSPS